MSLDLMKLELGRRVAVLPLEFTAWKAAVEGNKEGLGIHRSKLLALESLLEMLLRKQQALLAQVSLAQTLTGLAQVYQQIADELVGSHDVWRIFRQAMAQRLDAQFRRELDAADLVAADCYHACLNKAAVWKALPPDEKRPPPLVYLEPASSASTASRGKTLGALGLPLRYYRNLRLPVPIVFMPSDHIQSLWLYCALHHEVGHNLDRDLGLSQELQAHLLQQNALASQRQSTWWRWLPELTADAFGVLLGGAGFVSSVGSLLLMLAPSAQHQEFQPKEAHPNPYLRVPLLCGMLESLKLSDWSQVAGSIRSDWEELKKPGWVTEYLDDLMRLTRLVLDTRLEALKAHTVREFAPPWAQLLPGLQRLVEYLRTGKRRPSPGPYELTHRVVPVAAQLALLDTAPLETQTLEGLQTRALQYLHSIKRPIFMGTAAHAAQRAFFERLVTELDFTTPSPGEP